MSRLDLFFGLFGIFWLALWIFIIVRKKPKRKVTVIKPLPFVLFLVVIIFIYLIKYMVSINPIYLVISGSLIVYIFVMSIKGALFILNVTDAAIQENLFAVLQNVKITYFQNKSVIQLAENRGNIKIFYKGTKNFAIVAFYGFHDNSLKRKILADFKNIIMRNDVELPKKSISDYMNYLLTGTNLLDALIYFAIIVFYIIIKIKYK